MAKDRYHGLVKAALINDGWTITDDPYYLDEETKWQVDIGAEKLIGAEKDSKKIAVEVKSFLKSSFYNEFHGVVGQYMNYLLGLEEKENDRILFLAVPSDVYNAYFQTKPILRSINKLRINIIVYHIRNKNITKWIQHN